MIEDILNSISTGLKNALNEKAGIIEFDNFEYRKEICGIAKQIKLAKIYNITSF